MIITGLLKGWPFMASKVFLNEPVTKWWKALTIASSLSASHGVTHNLSRHELDGCTGEYQCTTWIILRIVFRKVLYFGTRLLIWHSISFLSYNFKAGSLVSAKFQLPFSTVMLYYWNFETEKSQGKKVTHTILHLFVAGHYCGGSFPFSSDKRCLLYVMCETCF